MLSGCWGRAQVGGIQAYSREAAGAGGGQGALRRLSGCFWRCCTSEMEFCLAL